MHFHSAIVRLLSFSHHHSDDSSDTHFRVSLANTKKKKIGLKSTGIVDCMAG